MSYDFANQTGLIPQQLFSLTGDGSQSINVSNTGITLGGDLTTTPITATISQSGIITDNPNGFNILSSLNMNQNDITNCLSISNSATNIDITSIADDVNITSGGGALITLNAGSQLNLNSNDLVNMSASTQINLTAINDDIILTAPNGIYINASSGGGGNGNITALNFLGNASTASTATNATNASLVAITDNNTSATYYPTFVSNNTGNLQLQVDKTTGPLNYIPSTGNLTATTFTGALSGTATSSTLASTITTTNTTTNATHYLNFSDSSSTGNGSVQKTAGLSCNPSTNTITATTFSGTATNSTNSAITDDNTNATFYPVFVSNNTGNLPLKVDKTTNPLSYNPSTGSLTATTFTGLCSTSGLVYLSTSQIAITGSASTQNLSFTSIFNSTYQNYRVVLNLASQVSFTSYPAYFLQAFTGTGVPTTASLYGNELTSSASSTISAVYTAGATISSAPLIFAVSSLTNKQVVIEVENVGFANTSANIVSLKCKSFYSNPGVVGYSDRNIVATSLSGATITGLTIQQSALGAGNNMTLQAVVYGYK
jgi:hypothetical protein